MDSVIERIQKGKFWQFHGGIHPPEQKFLTCNKPIAHMPIPTQLTIPIRQHIGQAGELVVNVGDTVLKGQALTRANSPMSLPVHAPTSGTITAIKAMTIPHPSGLSEPCIILTPDGEDLWQQRKICPDFQLLSKGQILEKIANAGIAGMGGAGFPTQVKAGTLAKIDYLIINAAECEPYITADDLLLQEHSPTVLDGINILDHLLAPKHILIAIEDNKAQAITALKTATAANSKVEICVIPTKYPSGGEKQLIKILTGQEVPSGVLPSSLGMVMQNVATCFAIADAVINDTPLIKRVVTVTGQALAKPQNFWALIGTPVGDLIERCQYQNQKYKHLIMGGPMMGFSLPHDQIPVVKTSNCILAPSEIEIASPFSSTSNNEVECIRCGQCADACPAQLLPQELQWSAKAKDHKQLESLNLFDCIECGACAYVCPSQIPLVHYYRVAKAEIRQQKLLDIKAEKAKVRFEARKQRLEREKIARAEKHRKAAEARKARMNAGTPAAKAEKSAVAAALARVKAKKAQTSDQQADAVAPEVSDSKKQVANAIARAKAKKLALKKQGQIDDLNTLQSNESQSSVTLSQAAPANSEQKAKVAAAIAKAKAKQQRQSLATTPEPESNATSTLAQNKPQVEVTNDKLAVNENEQSDAAQDNIDRQQKASITEEANTGTVRAANEDDNTRKAKVAAVVAKAKAKKLAEAKQACSSQDKDNLATKQHAQQPTAQQPQQQAEQTSDAAEKKARIAAAVAKAKAKKLAATTHKSQPLE
ncbi:electron transport complex protein RnfC [Colwellia chukchiensis]|uniref:Ion-translocating oxidoreductase complex subunit C n=1 Tax=Colwellia chukchiensis TaxID=641665 RepID=A0A1H7NLW3_9GAMM|nr:electron transport complex subunit RsxC [Colwellia chukchiensis]SEL24512.1 electron transport complex protein RnfC [Colwellia chukchiensis]